MIRKSVAGIGKRYFVIDSHRIIPSEIGGLLFLKLAVDRLPFRVISVSAILDIFLKINWKRRWLIKSSFDPDSFLRNNSLGRHKINAKIIISNGLLPLLAMHAVWFKRQRNKLLAASYRYRLLA